MDWPEIASAPIKNPQPSSTQRIARVSPPSRADQGVSAAGAETGHAQDGAVQLLERPAADQTDPLDIDSLPATPLSPRFRFDPLVEDPQRRTSKFRRLIQGGLLLGLVAGVGAFIVMLPGDDPSVTAGNRVETDTTPVAVADTGSNQDEPQIVGSLGDAGGLDDASGLDKVSNFSAPADGPAGGDGFQAAVAGVLDQTESAEPTTTTTTWVEPTMPPESEWVDSGNGVMVPDIQLRIRFCESTNNYKAANSGSSARGAYQFLSKSWDWYGHAAITGVSEAHLATPAQQDEAALRTLQAEGTSPWSPSRDCWADPDIDPRYATAPPPRPAPTTTTTVADGSSTSEGSTTTSDTNEGSTTTTDGSSTSTTETTTQDTTTSSTAGSTTTTVAETTTTTAP